VTECWIDLDGQEMKLNGVTNNNKLRCLKVGRSDSKRTVIFIHGGGGMASDWAPLFWKLKKADTNQDFQFWFLERPGHGFSGPFDCWTVADNLVQYHANLIEAVRRATGVEKIDIVSNSMGGWVSHCYASLYPQHVRTFTWVGAPAWYKALALPFAFKLMGSWIGTQLMSRPPPASVPEKLIFETFNQSKEAVPECCVELFRATMSLRNTSLSWNSLLRAALGHMKEIEYDLEDLDTFARQFQCQLIVGSDEPFLTKDKQKVIESKFGKAADVVGWGHLPWLEDPEGVAKAIIAALNSSN